MHACYMLVGCMQVHDLKCEEVHASTDNRIVFKQMYTSPYTHESLCLLEYGCLHEHVYLPKDLRCS